MPLTQPRIMVFAADHGIANAGVSAYPSEVTAQMVANYLSGGAAINVLARQLGLALAVIDAGVASPLAAAPGMIDCKIAPGTRNYRDEPAMTAQQRDASIATGRRLAAAAIADGSNALLLGEMGIGNTTAAAAVAAALFGGKGADWVGRGLVDVTSLVTRRYPLADINRAYEDIETDAVGRGVLVLD